MSTAVGFGTRVRSVSIASDEVCISGRKRVQIMALTDGGWFYAGDSRLFAIIRKYHQKYLSGTLW